MLIFVQHGTVGGHVTPGVVSAATFPIVAPEAIGGKWLITCAFAS